MADNAKAAEQIRDLLVAKRKAENAGLAGAAPALAPGHSTGTPGASAAA